MKKALILHGTDGTCQDNWFPWLKAELEAEGYQVWCPNLPAAHQPNIERYNTFLLQNTEFVFDAETILIGHSSGAVAILGLLEALPAETVVGGCYLVGSFKNDLGWDSLKQLFTKPFDFDKIKKKSRLWYFIHSDNDPYCPLEHAEYLHQQIGGDLIVLRAQKHFSVGTAGESYRQFPYLKHLIVGDRMTAGAVVQVYQEMLAKGVTLWLDGGWGVDALLEKQTRNHGDLDIVIQKKDVATLTGYLVDKGYWQIRRGDTTAHNFMFGNADAQFIDFHVIELAENGDGIYGPKEAGVFFPADSLTGEGRVNELTVRCIAPEWVVKFHNSGYPLRDKDVHDVLAVCQKFGLPVPTEYRMK